MSDEVDPSARRRGLMRKVAPLVLIVFVGVGVLLYRQRMPVDVGLRLVVPPTIHTSAGGFPRERTTALAGVILDADGAEVATFDVPLAGGLASPIAPPIGLQLRRGSYTLRVRARAAAGLEGTLAGRAEVAGGGEVRVELSRREP